MKFDVVFGGLSFEHEISIVSAIALKKVLGSAIEHFIFIDSTHHIYLIPDSLMTSKTFSSAKFKSCTKLTLSHNGFVKHTLFGTKALSNNTIINLIHGADGEDGTMAALFGFYNLNFIGPRVESSVLSFNKALTKHFATSRGVSVLDFKLFTRENRQSAESSLKGLGYPIILKPARLGSSIGVSVAKSAKELDYALDLAFEYDDLVVAEAFKSGVKEYNLAGCKIADSSAESSFIFSIIEEPKKREMLDFDNKYLDFSRTEAVAKADISEILESKLKDSFMKLYNNAFEGALIRCDFFVIDECVYLNEINPIPGSMANYLFSNFSTTLESLAKNLPKAKHIKVSYKYIEHIHHAKGK